MTINLKDLYGSQYAEQAERYQQIRKGFEETFGNSEGADFYSAPGRQPYRP